MNRRTVKLSEKAKFRLKVFDWYFKQSPRFSLSGLPDATLTCRHFEIHRSYFYRWKGRYNKKALTTLENRPAGPKRQRSPQYTQALVQKMRKIREEDPAYSGEKIRPILLRDMQAEQVPSVSTLGRLIRREKLFTRADVKQQKKHVKAVKTAHERVRKPYNLKADDGWRIIEFDMKHG